MTTSAKLTFNTIEEALEDLKAGKMIIVADDDDRENEGDLICAAEKITPEHINFMANHARGLICLTLNNEDTERLALNQMAEKNTESMQTAFTVSIDAKDVSTGISAKDRSLTIQTACDPKSKASDLKKPGHIFPLRAVAGGVLKRVGHTEAAVDLAQLAGLKPAGVICEILKEDGTMARRNELFEYAQKFNMKFITIADLVAYRLQQEKLIERLYEEQIQVQGRSAKVIAYKDRISELEHLAIVFGDPAKASEPSLVRVHNQSNNIDLALQFLMKGNEAFAAKMIEQLATEENSVFILLREPKSQNAIVETIRQINTLEQTEKENTSASINLRNYGTGAQIMRDLELSKIKLLSQHEIKLHGLEGFGLEVVETIKPK